MKLTLKLPTEKTTASQSLPPTDRIKTPTRNRTRSFDLCPRCAAPLTQSIAWSGTPSEFWKECTKCNTYVNTYIPQPHQDGVHRDPHRYLGNFGAFGTGKTLTSREEIHKHYLITPNANILVGANVQSQYEQTIKRELEGDLPRAFVKDHSTQKAYYDLINGARIMFRPFDDPDKLRSLNLTMFVILEGSEVKSEAYHQLKTRLRNTAAARQALTPEGEPVYKTTDRGQEIPVFAADWRKGIVESNPDSGWIRSAVLLASHRIHRYGGITEQYAQDPQEIDTNTASHVAASNVNSFLPVSFIEENCKGKPDWWIARYIRGSFSYSEGLVYPRAMETVVPYFEPPRAWKRLVAYDYGLHDPSVFVFAAVDEDEGIVYIYKVIHTKDKSVETLADMFKENTKDISIGGWAVPPIIDPKSGVKRDYNKKSLIDHFADYGIHFKPGQISLDARIYRVNTYIESGKLRIMDNCQYLINELREYKFPHQTLGNEKRDLKPEDKNNHAVDPLGWICMELPADPRHLTYGIFDGLGNLAGIPRKKPSGPWQLADPLPVQPGYDEDGPAFGLDYY